MPEPDPSDDPHALWKPGYSGGFRTPDSSAVGPDPDRDPRRLGRLLALGTVVVLVLGGAALATRFRSDPEPRVPEPWSTTLDAATVGALAASPDRVVALVDRPGVLVVFDLADGVEQWRRTAPGDSATGLDIVAADRDDGGGDDGRAAVVVRHVDADGSGSVLALDLESGATRWRWALAVGERVDVIGADLVRTSVRDTPKGPAGAARLDPLTGEVVEVLDGVPDSSAATDNVIRGFFGAGGSGRHVAEIPGGLVEVLIDPSVGATTFSFVPSPPD